MLNPKFEINIEHKKIFDFEENIMNNDNISMPLRILPAKI
jgi:hypothetical protein